MNRRQFLARSPLLLAMASSTGCVTSSGWRTYHESVSSVLISADEAQLVVMTARYHYIFPAPPALVRTLKGSFHPYVVGILAGFRVFSGGNTVGTVTLVISHAPGDVVEEAVKAGYERTQRGADLVVSIQGQRYRAGSVKAQSQYALNKTYDIEVTSEQSEIHVSDTPIKVAGGALVMGMVVLFPVAVFVGCATSGSLANCHE